MKAAKVRYPATVPSIWGWIVSLVFFNDTNAKKFAFGCLPWAIWQLQVQGTQSEIAFFPHFINILCPRLSEKFQKVQNNVYKCRKRPRNTISRKYWAIPIFPDCLRNFKRSKIMYINVENDPEIRFLENIEQFLFSQTTLDRIFDKNDKLREILEIRVFT